ncbi:MAG: NAD(P)-dependent alcohol dehydrogenase [Myxococcota bacterium]
MQKYVATVGGGVASLRLTEAKAAKVGPGEVRVQVEAVSLNRRDLMILEGGYPVAPGDFVPVSDGAGIVTEVGPGVTWKVGDRVVASFFPDWHFGDPRSDTTARSLGTGSLGMLASEVVLPANGLVRAPTHLSAEQAATLPCAGVTAWHALFEVGALKRDGWVLLQGTGGVSIFGLQLARAAGYRAVITSSSDEKLARARSLGASATVNYRTSEDWADDVATLTGGVDRVIEVGGSGTLEGSVRAARPGARIAIIGGLTGFEGGVSALDLIFRSLHLDGILIGSRSMLEDLSRFLEATGIEPVVDQVFPFARAADAFRTFGENEHFGKIVVTLNPGKP